jgi:hypothetical protein
MRMREKRFTFKELMNMSSIDFRLFCNALSAGAFRVLGIPWTERVEWYHDEETGDLVFHYE